MDAARSWASRLVAVEGLIGTTRDKVARVKKSSNVMKGTSTVCAAVPREGRVVGCWPPYIRLDPAAQGWPKALGYCRSSHRLHLLHPPTALGENHLHEIVHPMVAQVFSGVSLHVQTTGGQVKVKKAPSR